MMLGKKEIGHVRKNFLVTHKTFFCEGIVLIKNENDYPSKSTLPQNFVFVVEYSLDFVVQKTAGTQAHKERQHKVPRADICG